MYKNNVFPNDDSALSQKVVRSGILFARNISATITGIHAAPQSYEERLKAWMHHDEQFVERRQVLFEKFTDGYPECIASSTLAAGIPSTCKLVKADEVYQAIVKTAEQVHCDLVFKASIGWKRDAVQRLESEILNVLFHGRVPVPVHKPAAND